jgi:pimeloyl-ACP methyl ester carboxylesterase
LLVRAGDSDVFSPEQYQAMLDVQHRASGLVIEGSGHFLPLDRAIEVADALEAFLHEEALDITVIGDAREMLEIP